MKLLGLVHIVASSVAVIFAIAVVSATHSAWLDIEGTVVNAEGNPVKASLLWNPYRYKAIGASISGWERVHCEDERESKIRKDCRQIQQSFVAAAAFVFIGGITNIVRVSTREISTAEVKGIVDLITILALIAAIISGAIFWGTAVDDYAPISNKRGYKVNFAEDWTWAFYLFIFSSIFIPAIMIVVPLEWEGSRVQRLFKRGYSLLT